MKNIKKPNDEIDRSDNQVFYRILKIRQKSCMYCMLIVQHFIYFAGLSIVMWDSDYCVVSARWQKLDVE